MAYNPLYRKYFTQYHTVSDLVRIPETTKYRCFLEAIANYALTIDSSFDRLYGKEDVGAIHLLRMLIDATTKCYGILLVVNPETYLDRFLRGGDVHNFKLRDDRKKYLNAGNILSYMEEEYTGIKAFWDDSNRYIHPSNFYCYGVMLEEETKKALYGSQSEGLVKNMASLNQWKEKKWVYKVMCIINEVLLDVMKKVAKLGSPKHPVLPQIIDITTGKIIDNPEYKKPE